jgi:chromosome partitioning protein
LSDEGLLGREIHVATVVSFINFKGGVGKTTLCVEMAASLAYRYNEKVLLVDLDPQTNATLSLMDEKSWVAHAENKGTLREFFEACFDMKEFDLSRIVVHNPPQVSQLENLHLLPSHIELFGMDLRLAQRFGWENLKARWFLRRALEPLQGAYTYIVIDCPPNLYLATQNGLFASDNYVIVALPEISLYSRHRTHRRASGCHIRERTEGRLRFRRSRPSATGTCRDHLQ